MVTPAPDDLRAWRDFRAALRELGQTDPQRARLYLEGAAASLRDWTRALRRERPAAPPRRSARLDTEDA